MTGSALSCNLRITSNDQRLHMHRKMNPALPKSRLARFTGAVSRVAHGNNEAQEIRSISIKVRNSPAGRDRELLQSYRWNRFCT